VQGNGRHVLIDVGSGDTLGPETGWLAANLAAAHTEPADIDHVLLTHLHPDHAGGLISPDGQPVFPRATVHAARADAEHWFDPVEAAAAAGLQRFVFETAARVLAPYRDTGRFVTFENGAEAVPGVRTVNLRGHTPGHTATSSARVMRRCCSGAISSTTTPCSCDSHTCQQRLTRMKTPQLSLGAASCSSHRRTDGGWAPPTCPSRVWAMFAPTPIATRGCRSPTHRSRNRPLIRDASISDARHRSKRRWLPSPAV
jgi:Metallo-beta-lactamase superfamily